VKLGNGSDVKERVHAVLWEKKGESLRSRPRKKKGGLLYLSLGGGGRGREGPCFPPERRHRKRGKKWCKFFCRIPGKKRTSCLFPWEEREGYQRKKLKRRSVPGKERDGREKVRALRRGSRREKTGLLSLSGEAALEAGARLRCRC